MSNIPVIYFNKIRTKIVEKNYSVELVRFNNMTEKQDNVTGILYMDLDTALLLFQEIRKDLKALAESHDLSFPTDAELDADEASETVG